MKHIYFIIIFNLIFTLSYAQLKVVEITHYVFPEFSQGYVLMSDGTKYTASLNYNSLTEEMIFENEERKLAFSDKELELTDTIYIQDRKFIVLNTKVMEVIFHSNWNLYAEHRCNVKEQGQNSGYGGTSQVASINNISSIAGGKVYELELPDDFEAKPYIIYWLNKNGEFTKFDTMRQLKKIYDDKKGLYKDFVKKNKVKYNNQESIIQLINYLEAS